MVAVMKKFHGRRVPRPKTKKMIHTAWYLERQKKKRVTHEGFWIRTPGPTPELGRLTEQEHFSHLSRGALMAVMVPSGWSSVIREVLGLKSTEDSCINVTNPTADQLRPAPSSFHQHPRILRGGPKDSPSSSNSSVHQSGHKQPINATH